MDPRDTFENWEEEELDNPIGRTRWVLNPLICELTVLNTIKTTPIGEKPWSTILLDIESVVVMDGVVAIGGNAFAGNILIKRISIPPSVTSIGDKAFSSCYECKSFALPDSIKTIGYAAFSYCSFSEFRIPKSVVSFGGNPFAECRDLKEIDVSENPNFAFADEVLMNKVKTSFFRVSPQSKMITLYQTQ